MYYTIQEKTILKELSYNSRATISHLAKAAQTSRANTVKLMDKLALQLGIRFTLEINMEKMGLSERYLVAVKFRKKPSDAELKGIFEGDKYAQCVFSVKGKLDLLIYAVADSAVNYTQWETRIAERLSEYGAIIMPSRYIFSHFGYLPMNESFANFIDTGSRIDDADKKMLKMLNDNSRAGYAELGKAAGISEATARYRLFRLMEKGVITRFTIAVQSPPEGYSCFVYFINYTFTRTTSSVSFTNARNCYFSDDDDNPLLNTFQLIFPISGSFRSFGMVLSESRKLAFDKAVKRHRKIFRSENIRIIYGELSRVPIKGLFPFRNLDIKSNYRIVSWHGTGI